LKDEDLVGAQWCKSRRVGRSQNLEQVGSLERGQPSSALVTRCRSGERTTRRPFSEDHERRGHEGVPTATRMKTWRR
jgi:hypothetical protein